jgi:hypothetical protein
MPDPQRREFKKINFYKTRKLLHMGKTRKWKGRVSLVKKPQKKRRQVGRPRNLEK